MLVAMVYALRLTYCICHAHTTQAQINLNKYLLPYNIVQKTNKQKQ